MDPEDDDTALLPHDECMKTIHDPPTKATLGQERRLRRLEAWKDEVDARHHRGDLILQKIQGAIDRFSELGERLEKRFDTLEIKTSAMNPWLQRTLEAAVSWGVPVIILCLLWVMAQAGHIPGVKP